MHIVVATDAAWVLDELRAALVAPDTTFTICSDGRAVTEAVRAQTPDIAVLDLQIGTMGGMAVTMQLRLDESSELLPHIPVLMLLDRSADIHLARRSAADGWLIKPLDALRIRRAVAAVAGGGTHHEGVPAETPPVPETVTGEQHPETPPNPETVAGEPNAETPNGEPAATG